MRPGTIMFDCIGSLPVAIKQHRHDLDSQLICLRFSANAESKQKSIPFEVGGLRCSSPPLKPRSQGQSQCFSILPHGIGILQRLREGDESSDVMLPSRQLGGIVDPVRRLVDVTLVSPLRDARVLCPEVTEERSDRSVSIDEAKPKMPIELRRQIAQRKCCQLEATGIHLHASTRHHLQRHRGIALDQYPIAVAGFEEACYRSVALQHLSRAD